MASVRFERLQPCACLKNECCPDLAPGFFCFKQQQKHCTYCYALDNGTCAYPSEEKTGCLLTAHRERMRALLKGGQ